MRPINGIEKPVGDALPQIEVSVVAQVPTLDLEAIAAAQGRDFQHLQSPQSSLLTKSHLCHV